MSFRCLIQKRPWVREVPASPAESSEQGSYLSLGRDGSLRRFPIRSRRFRVRSGRGPTQVLFEKQEFPQLSTTQGSRKQFWCQSSLVPETKQQMSAHWSFACEE